MHALELRCLCPDKIQKDIFKDKKVYKQLGFSLQLISMFPDISNLVDIVSKSFSIKIHSWNSTNLDTEKRAKETSDSR